MKNIYPIMFAIIVAGIFMSMFFIKIVDTEIDKQTPFILNGLNKIKSFTTSIEIKDNNAYPESARKEIKEK